MKTTIFTMGVYTIICLTIAIFTPISQAADFHELIIENSTSDEVGFKITKTDAYAIWFNQLYEDQEFIIKSYVRETKKTLPLLGGTYYVKFRIGYSWSSDCSYYQSEEFTLDEISSYSTFATQLTITLTRTMDIPGNLSWHPISKTEYDQ